MSETGTHVTLRKEVYEELLKDRKELYALHAGGVDNWEYYSDALRDAGFFDDEDEDY